MPSTAILQSFRTADVPQWVIRCQHSVHAYAKALAWNYHFLGDELFDFAPAWVRETLAGSHLCTLSDLCRLEWMKQCLERYEIVFWADIDVLIYDSARLQIDTSLPHGFAYELSFDQAAARDSINNSFMFFRRSSHLLEEYLRRCYEVLKQGRDTNTLARTAMGPTLLQELSIPASHVIRGINILNFNAIRKIYNDPERQFPSYIADRVRDPLGAANLCLNERSLFSAEQQPQYDSIVDQVVRSLLGASRSDGP